MKKKTYKSLKIPIIIIELYLSFTVVLYVIGPWKWRTSNPILFYSMLLVFQCALALGYMSGIKKRINYKINEEFIENERKSYTVTNYSTRFLKALLIINFIFVILNVMRSLNLSSFSIQSLWNQVIIGLTNPASQYRESKTIITKFGGSILSYANVLLAPILWMSIPLSLFRFKELTTTYKILSIITIVLEVARWLGIGTNKGIFDIILILLAIFMIKKLSPIKKNKQGIWKMCSKGGKVWIVLSFALICIAVYSFSSIVGDRVQDNWGNLSITNGYTQIDFESPLMAISPSFLKPTLIYLGSYLTQGYYALSLSTTVEWIPMFGVGNSMFLMENISSIIDIDLYQLTYQTRLEGLGWNPFVNWHSFYLWIANDVSLFGVAIVMYILGRFFAAIVYDAIIIGDNIAVVLFCLLAILFVYIPANNQVLSYPATAMAFWVLTLIWCFKKKYRLKVK